MSRLWILLPVLAFLLSFSGGIHATPLRMDYEVTDAGGGLFQYDFDLILDDNDGSWEAGQGWAWIIFGDVIHPNDTNLTNWIGDVASLTDVWTYFGTSSGAHNGPTLHYVLDLWIPSNVGEKVSWGGTSSVDLSQGELLWSSIEVKGGSKIVEWEVAERVSTVPEPTTVALLGIGIVGMAGARRRRKKRAVDNS